LLCAQVINSIFGDPIDYEKVGTLVKDAHFDTSDIKAIIAALHFILTNAAKYDVDDTTLSNELGQLGLPKEHCDSFARPYRDNKDKLRAVAKTQILKFPQFESIDWRVDYILSSSHLKDVNSPTVQLNLNIKTQQDGGEGATVAKPFEVSAEKFRVLYYELKQARDLIASLEL